MKNMPNQNGTGPAGQGLATGRGMGPCGSGRAIGRGPGRGVGRGSRCFRNFPGSLAASRETEKEILTRKAEGLESELKSVRERLSGVGSE